MDGARLGDLGWALGLGAVERAGSGSLRLVRGTGKGLPASYSGTVRDDSLAGSFSTLPCRNQRTASRQSSRIR